MIEQGSLAAGTETTNTLASATRLLIVTNGPATFSGSANTTLTPLVSGEKLFAVVDCPTGDWKLEATAGAIEYSIDEAP